MEMHIWGVEVGMVILRLVDLDAIGHDLSKLANCSIVIG
jgi:hypothetical protein